MHMHVRAHDCAWLISQLISVLMMSSSTGYTGKQGKFKETSANSKEKAKKGLANNVHFVACSDCSVAIAIMEMCMH